MHFTSGHVSFLWHLSVCLSVCHIRLILFVHKIADWNAVDSVYFGGEVTHYASEWWCNSKMKVTGNENVKIVCRACLHKGTYLSDELRRPAEWADTEDKKRLRSTSSTSLAVRHTRLSTVDERRRQSVSCCVRSSVEQLSMIAYHRCFISLHLSLSSKFHLFRLSFPNFWLFSLFMWPSIMPHIVLHPSVCPSSSVRPSVRLSVRLSVSPSRASHFLVTWKP